MRFSNKALHHIALMRHSLILQDKGFSRFQKNIAIRVYLKNTGIEGIFNKFKKKESIFPTEAFLQSPLTAKNAVYGFCRRVFE